MRFLTGAVLVLVAVGLTACAPPSEIAKRITYFKDSRTGLCFAVITYGDDYDPRSLTYVPCTPEVEKLLNTK